MIEPGTLRFQAQPQRLPVTQTPPSPHNGETIIRLLVAQGLITEEQRAYVKRIKAKLISERSLVEICKELHLLTNQQLNQVLKMQRPNILIGDQLVELGHIRQGELLGIDDIGMAPRMLQQFRDGVLASPSGIIVVTGPTGAGKTTTLYSCVNHLNDLEASIIPAENPVEYVIDGISQCSINPKIGLTFTETLRHIVRQDPDIIVMGEVRDTFSAETAIQASLTGHKVLTTFHTEDAVGGLLRLLNMGIEAFLIASTINFMLAQRLLRRVCPKCAAAYVPTPDEYRRLGYTHGDLVGANLQIGRGCSACQFTGYQGRVGILELLILNDDVKEAILARKTVQDIRRISIESSGLITLLENGLAKAALGKVSIAEVMRRLPRPVKPRPLHGLRRLLGESP